MYSIFTLVYRIKKNFLYTVLLLLSAISSDAQDHLEPVGRSLTEMDVVNYTTLRKKIVGDMPDNSDVRFVVLPSSRLRTFFDIVWDDSHNKFYVIVSQVTNSYKNGNDIVEEISKGQREISEESAVLIKHLFLQAVKNQKEYKGQRDTKEVVYYFAVRTNQLLWGTSSSPLQESLIGKLVAISTEFLAIAQNKSDEIIVFDTAFQDRINALIAKLN